MGIPFIMQSIALISAIACNEIKSSNINDGDNSTLAYDPGELLTKIFNLESSHGRSSNGFSLENQNNIVLRKIYVSNNAEETSISSPIDNANPQYAVQHNIDQSYGLTYNDDNGVRENKKKRRNRKPGVQRLQGLEYPGHFPQSLSQFGIRTPPYIRPGYQGPIYRPTEPPKPSLALEALSTVTEALTSLALYDDLQCVPRLLCEAASGGVLGSSQTLQSISGLQPLLTLLSAYNDISSNPLFVFGRAAFLGMSSKNNPGSCRYAYPQCPNDPEKLVYYLNNHNGGFFRFFNAPQRGQQNIGQFYDELSQNYQNPYQVSLFQHYNGADNNLYHHQQNLIQDNNIQNYGVRYPYKDDKYGLLNNVRFKNNDDFGVTNRIEKRIQNKPGLFLNSDEDLSVDDFDENYQNGKWSFPHVNDAVNVNSHRYKKGLKFPEYINHKTEVDLENVDTYRFNKGLKFPHYINQNKEIDLANDDTYRVGKGLKFPHYINHNQEIDLANDDTYRISEGLKFPEHTRENIDHTKSDPRVFVFPDKQTDRYLNFNRYQAINLSPHNKDNDNYFNAYSTHNDHNERGKDQSIRTVYVVRGNSDPRYPEVVNLKPGQSVH